MLIIVKKNMSGKVLLAVADITEGRNRFEGPTLFVGDILIKNVGLEDTRKIIMERAVGVIVTPKNQNSIVTIISSWSKTSDVTSCSDCTWRVS